MFEVSESQYKPVGQGQVKLGGTAGTWAQVVRDTIQGAINTKLIQPGEEIVSIYHRCAMWWLLHTRCCVQVQPHAALVLLLCLQ